MKVEKAAYTVLTMGLIVSVSLLATGLALRFTTYGEPLAQAILFIAAIALILTPLVTIVTIFAVFISNREIRNAIVALIVLMLMLLSAMLGVIFRIKIR
ncbi:MAG: hypothetical protein DRJ51_05060 [Thermoprotei archaeon]|nr:MAG: hypothetical protein DRJ51_05060 [Thermoprotei archaeon]RLF00322.1 MAG: hypothetical protein DRJ59_07305 [Thermoprotei archaeon]